MLAKTEVGPVLDVVMSSLLSMVVLKIIFGDHGAGGRDDGMCISMCILSVFLVQGDPRIS